MPITEFHNVANGVNKDVSPDILPGHTKELYWTTVRNMRPYNNQMLKMNGYVSLIDTSTTIAPYYHVRVSTPTANHYVYLGLTKAYDFYNNTHYEITKTATSYGATSDITWSHTILNGFPIFVNYNDTPQMWNPISQTQKLTDLSNWPTGYKTNVIRSYKQYLIALDVTTATPTRKSNMVKWSTYALPGALPTTWDPADVTQDAGEIELSDTPGGVIDGGQLGEYFIVYKQSSTYIMQWIGGNEVMAFKLAFPNIGMIAKNCFAAIGGQHFVVTNDDIILHDGFQYKSIADGKVRKYLFSNINSKRAHISFVVPHYAKGEIWYCYPKGSSTWCNEALVFNYNNNTWTIRTLPQTTHITAGFVDITALGIWTDYSSTPWSTAAFVWGASSYNTNLWSLTMAVPSDNTLHYLDGDDSLTDNGSMMDCILERENLELGPPVEQIKTIRRIWPRIDLYSTSDPVIRIEVGTQIRKGDPITWQGPYNFNVVTDDKIDVFATGRYLSIRFSTISSSNWALDHFDVDYSPRGLW